MGRFSADLKDGKDYIEENVHFELKNFWDVEVVSFNDSIIRFFNHNNYRWEQKNEVHFM